MGFECIAILAGQKVCDFLENIVLGELCGPIGKSICKMCCVKSNVEKLKKQAEDLERRKNDVNDDVKFAESLGQQIREVVTKWLLDVEDVDERLAYITDEGNLTCLTLYPFSVEADKLVKDVAELLDRALPAFVGKFGGYFISFHDGDDDDGDDDDGDDDDFSSAELLKKVFQSFVGKYGGIFFWFNDGDDNDFPSRKSRIIDVMEALKNLVIEVIRLHGMGCVGKTTIVRKVYSQLTKEPRLFDQVVMAEVSQNPDLIKVQRAIADRLGLKLQGETVDTRASQLRQWLKEKKSVLVILDDFWQELDLKAIGIPFGNADQGQCRMVVTSTGIPFGNADQGQCRIVVTSRSQNVCTTMKFEKHISVKPLSYEDACTLFWKTVDDAEKQSQLGSIATKIVEKCDGLPVAILAIAKTLKDSDHFVWNEVSKELANFDCIDAVPDFHPVLKLSYDYLKNEKAKLLFLLFGLHEVGQPVLIEHLVRCVIGLGFLLSVTTMKAARDEVDQLIKELKNANLLLDSDRKDMVKMHDVIHVVAQKIASREHKMFYIQDVVYLNEELEKDIYKDSTAISLHYREVPAFLEKLNSPQLQLLLPNSEGKYEDGLHGYDYSSKLKVSDTFLDGMKELRVLVLNGVCLQSCIPSLNYESNIRTLSLECYNFENITNVGMLKKLEVLTFSGPDIRRLSEEIGDLTRLKLLDLEHCSNIEVIPPNVISKLTRLEELYVGDSFVNWDTPDNASLIELKQLHDLVILYIHIKDAQIIPQDFLPEKLERFKIFIGDGWIWRLNTFEEREMSRVLKLKLSRKFYPQCGVEKLMQKTEGLFLDEIHGIWYVDPNLGGRDFPDLKHLRIQNNPDLRKVCHGDSREEPFRKLEVIDVEHCDSLKQLISSSMRCLVEIKVTKCRNLTEIFGNDLPEMVSFPSLKYLTLSSLDIRNIWCNQLQSSYSFGEALTSLCVSDCPLLKFLFSSSMVNGFQQLEELKVDRCDSMEVIINKEGSSGEKKVCLGDSREEPFRKLKVIDVAFCDALTQPISSSMTRLEEINVSCCENLTEIVGNDVPDDSITVSEIVFTELCTLTLGLLPRLVNFGPTAISRTPENIQEGGDEDFALFDNKVSFPKLKNLTLYTLNIRNIWCNQLPSSYSFGETLTSLDVFNCRHLKFLFPSSMVNGLQQLEKLNVANCESMEVIINKEWSSGEKVCGSVEEIFEVPPESSRKSVAIFPKLAHLTLSGLRKLKSFYDGLHVSEWSSLKELTIKGCDKVEEIFGLEFQSLHEERQSAPLFIANEDAFPRLEKLELQKNDNVKEIWHGGGIISKTLLFRGKTNIIEFPHYLLPTDTLDVSSGYFKQIGGGSDSDNTFTAALRQLRTLTVDDEDDDLLDEYFESSDSLACLVSSWVSFQNLTNLEITYVCSGFRYLLTYSTATSLQHLTRLKISYCEKIEVIIMPPIDEVNDEIVFGQLKYLELHDLESLTSFYSGIHTLEFPSLEKMIVCGCPNMKVFSEGDSITPALRNIQIENDYDGEWRWEGDLNSTIQKMFKEMVGLKGLDELKLSGFLDLGRIWHFSGKLRRLTVDNCVDISSAIPLDFLRLLKGLYRLTIKDCDSLEEVIDLEGLGADDQPMLLRRLSHLSLIGLPRLRNIWRKCHLEIMRFTNLTWFSVSKCNSLRYIFTTTIIHCLKQLQEVKIRDCAMVETIIIDDRENDASRSDIVVRKLRFIVLESLPKLTCFHSGSNVLECSSLKTMTINDCPQMKTFVFTSTEDHDLQDTPLFNEKVAFPNLEELKLSKLPMVEHLWTKPCKAFQHLATVEISECVNLKSLVPSSASLQSLTTLEVSQCDGLTSLVTLPTAKSLEQLAKINVASCKIMREIITHIHIGDEENDRIVFGQLKYIGLHCLPNITGFYLGDYTIEFLALEQVVVRQCQKMNTFSKGVVSTPKLKRVQCTEDEEEGRWENNLNTTVQLLFEETNVQSQKED